MATVALAAHPGGLVRSAILSNASAASDRFRVTAGGGAFVATDTSVHMDLGPDARADMLIDRPVRWPRAFGGGGVFSAVPFLGQYWHPHLLGGSAQATAQVGDEQCDSVDGDVYAEKNWGAELIRLAPPFSRVHSEADGTRWEVNAHGHGYRVHIVGTAIGDPHVLPVPLPAERRNVDTDFEHLAGNLRVEITGRLILSDSTELAGLDIGTRPSPGEPHHPQ